MSVEHQFDNRRHPSHNLTMPNLAAYVPEPDPNQVFRTAERHQYCLNGHHLDRAGRNCGFDHGYWLSAVTCMLCHELRLPRATWDEVEHLQLGAEHPPTHARLVLDIARPPVRAGVGQITARLDGTPIADVDLRMCPVDERGVLEHVRVDDQFRRRGLAGVLVAAALARGPGFHWSTTVVGKAVEARAFWASVRPAVPLQIGEPFYCSHMREADGELI
jgi:GNAT superfamily N-acetyltransferase